ncbi:putative Zinc finger, RanBP2-type [Helianthus anomalus]
MPNFIFVFVCYSDKDLFASVTRNYFENLVRALENGLSDVDARGGTSRTGGSRGLGAGSSKNSRNKGAAPPAARSRNIDDSGHWSCEYCTFANVRSANVCQMCQHRR